MFGLQGVPGTKGDTGEPGKRGQDGNPVSSCPIGHTRMRTWLLHVLSYMQGWSWHCLGVSLAVRGGVGSEEGGWA